MFYIFLHVSGLHGTLLSEKQRSARPLWLTKLRLYLAPAPADAAVPVESFIR